MMQNELDTLLNDLLVKWHTYCAHVTSEGSDGTHPAGPDQAL